MDEKIVDVELVFVSWCQWIQRNTSSLFLRAPSQIKQKPFLAILDLFLSSAKVRCAAVYIFYGTFILCSLFFALSWDRKWRPLIFRAPWLYSSRNVLLLPWAGRMVFKSLLCTTALPSPAVVPRHHGYQTHTTASLWCCQWRDEIRYGLHSVVMHYTLHRYIYYI